MNDVPLDRLTHDIVQNAYKDLHALLDSLSDLAPEDRTSKLLDFTMKTRHRYARLTVAVRWFMSYSAFHDSARAARELALNRSGVFQTNADVLCHISAFVKSAALHHTAVQEAAEVFGASAFFARIPRVIETGIGLDLSANAHELRDSEKDFLKSSKELTAEATERLRAVTRYAVSSILPAGVCIMASAVNVHDDPCVRVGIPGAWTGDIVLNSLKADEAYFRLLRFNIIVDAHPDAPGDLHVPWREREAAFALREHREALRQMLEDRMAFEANHAQQSGDSENRLRKSMCSLVEAMSYDCAGKLALDHVRAQASALLMQNAWKPAGLALSGVGSQAADDRPVRLRYWQKSYMKSALSVVMRNEVSSEKWDGTILHVEHENATEKNLPSSVRVRSVYMEGLLLDTCRARAANELERLRKLCTAHLPEHVSAHVMVRNGTSAVLGISFDGHGLGLSFGISSVSGAYTMRVLGTTLLARHGSESKAVVFRKHVWEGERFFIRGLRDANKAVLDLIHRAFELLRVRSAMTSSCAIGAGALPKWPPGPASVEAPEETSSGRRVLPPLMPLDKKRPNRFLSLVSVAQDDDEVYIHPGSSAAKRARSLPMHYSLSASGDAFIEGRRPEGIKVPEWSHGLLGSASRMADWAEIRHAVLLRMRRDNLLRELEDFKLASAIDGDYSLRSPYYCPLKIKTSPLELDGAALALLDNEAWQIQLTLTDDIFDEDPLRGRIICYSSKRRLLTYTYSTVSRQTLKRFAMDLLRTRTTAALLQAFSDTDSTQYKVATRFPLYIQVKAHGILFSVGTSGYGLVQVDATPAFSTLSTHVIPFMEEVLQASGKEMGQTLSGLLELSVPVANMLHSLVRKAPAISRVKFSTALRARLIIMVKSHKRPCALEVDMTRGSDKIVLSDYQRYMIHSQKNAAATQQAIPIPNWEGAVNGLVAKGFAEKGASSAAVQVPMRTLAQCLVAILKASQLKSPGRQ